MARWLCVQLLPKIFIQKSPLVIILDNITHWGLKKQEQWDLDRSVKRQSLNGLKFKTKLWDEQD